MSLSTFSNTGIEVGDNSSNMAYLYGISDFFSVMFEDTSKTNLMLEASSTVASQIYSEFLQLTSTISLEDIQNFSGKPLKLVTIRNTDLVKGEVNLYELNDSISSSNYIANRPFLPTTTYEQDIDYGIFPHPTDFGKYRIRFAKPLETSKFPVRVLSDETTLEYALWFVDTQIDEQWMSNNYASLIGVAPESSTDSFKNFVYGLYFIYSHGPSLDLLRKGLNLCIGIPLARSDETIIDIRKYLNTDDYLVVTDQNQYLVPYGLEPVVNIGDSLSTGDEISHWVEIKDYLNDGDWWIDLYIPTTLIPEIPAGQVNRYASVNSQFDYVMRNYLKTHTFLVNIKVRDFKNSQSFLQISDIIHNAKPSYTYGVYIWSLPQEYEYLNLDITGIITRRDQFRCENLTLPIDKFYRANVNDPLFRGCPTFIRYNVPSYVTKLCGTNDLLNGVATESEGTVITSYRNSVHQIRDNTSTEKAWLRTILERGSETNRSLRTGVGFYRGVSTTYGSYVSELGDSGSPTHWDTLKNMVSMDRKIIPLYLTTQHDLGLKCATLGINTPSLDTWIFRLPDDPYISDAIDEQAVGELANPIELIPVMDTSYNKLTINTQTILPGSNFLKDNFSILFFRGIDTQYLSNVVPELGFQTWAPDTTLDLRDGDFILGVRVYGEVVGMYWVTSNTFIKSSIYFPVEEPDALAMSFKTSLTRGLAPGLSPYYIIRGRGHLDYNNADTAINPYVDTENVSPITMNRSGISINHKMEYK